LPKDIIKEPPKDFPKDLPKDVIKDGPKDPPKEFPKDIVKEPPKDFAKDGVKDFPKDGVKDFPKDGIKDLPKDLAKDPGWEPGKVLSADLPPKSVFDPPKSFMEPPVDFPVGGIGPLGPVFGGGAMPFTLATGISGGGVGRQSNAAAANAYLQLLAQFARLHAAGHLDAAGLAAWQEAAAAYQRLISGL
jgi:hypothetical protein